jgi:hypothetical protein
MLTMEAWRLTMEPWRVCIPVVAELHHCDQEQDPDPQANVRPDLDQHQSERSDPDPHQCERSDLDPHQNEKADPDLDPQQRHTDPQHCPLALS